MNDRAYTMIEAYRLGWRVLGVLLQFPCKASSPDELTIAPNKLTVPPINWLKRLGRTEERPERFHLTVPYTDSHIA